MTYVLLYLVSEEDYQKGKDYTHSTGFTKTKEYTDILENLEIFFKTKIISEKNYLLLTLEYAVY